jgi:hypothetical protein
MTIDTRVADVIAIIGRDKAQVDKIKEAVRTLDGLNRTYGGPFTKKNKAAARSLAKSLKRVEHVLNRDDLRHVLHYYEIDEWVADLKRFRRFVEEDANLQLGKPKPSAEKFARKHRAVEVAAKLLESHGLPLTATRKTDTQQASVFCRVAAALTGEKRADLYHQCRAYIQKSAEPVSKESR